jgi:hypothetical protein
MMGGFEEGRWSFFKAAACVFLFTPGTPKIEDEGERGRSQNGTDIPSSRYT